MSCKDNNNNNDMVEKDNNQKIEYRNNTFKDGEMQVNFEEFINKNASLIEEKIIKRGFIKPNLKFFIERIKVVYGWDIEKYRNVIVLQKDLMPEIVIKDKCLIYVEGENEEIEGELLFHYNQFIINNNSVSFNWLKNHRPDLLISLVKNFDYIGDDEVLEFVFKKIDFNNKIDVNDLIFDYKDQKYILRKSMINKIREIKYKNQRINSFSDSIEGDFFNTIPDIVNTIDEKGNEYEKKEYVIAFLFNELCTSGNTDFLYTYFNRKPFFLKLLINNDFYNFSKLKDFSALIYDSDSKNEVFRIYDKDGYTNLRKGKSSSSEIIGKINTGTEIFILDENDKDWWLIETTIGEQGYIHKSRIVKK
ncbi:hypothetical protein BWK58_08340 [Flavobacterium columnare]|nr:hypothetical protein BWK58_08340 [Flavobacterium columnare]